MDGHAVELRSFSSLFSYSSRRLASRPCVDAPCRADTIGDRRDGAFDELHMRTWIVPSGSRRFGIAAGVISLVLALQLLPARAWNQVGLLLLPPLTERFDTPPLASMAEFSGIIVAGGSPERVREAGRLARALPRVTLYVSSAGEAEEVMALLGDGVDASRVEVENLARTTYENAQYARRFLDPDPSQRWLLVTSAFHMPRAMGTFRKAGFDVTAWPVDDIPPNYLQSHLVARHEWLGLAWYWLLGRSSALYPAPGF